MAAAFRSDHRGWVDKRPSHVTLQVMNVQQNTHSKGLPRLSVLAVDREIANDDRICKTRL
jgi:hypothetical protein